MSERRLIFLSHATPQDNVFATWLATQLAIAGYEVWCDVTKLLGGERFWNDITEAISLHSFRFLFASTIESNRKAGTERELKIATEAQKKFGLKDFVVPLKVDQFPFQATLQAIRELNFIRFDESRAAGLSQLLKLLEREGAPKSETAGPACVSEWYRRSLEPQRQVVISNETCYSNWFRLYLPKQLRFHYFTGLESQLESIASTFPYPYRIHGRYLVSFSPARDVRERLGTQWDATKSVEPLTASFSYQGNERLNIDAFTANNIVHDLVRQSWDQEMSRQGLHSHMLASALPACFFKNGHLQKNKAFFTAYGGRRTYRQLVGHKSKRTAEGVRLPDGFWHYAISASPQLAPFPRLVFRHHVVFTDDGKTPWQNAQRMHKARRGVCKNWWNREWRDRLFAFCATIGAGATELAITVGAGQSIRVGMVPMSFVSPWTYYEDGETGLNEENEVELVEESEEDDEDEET
jgi:hypothetical protein